MPGSDSYLANQTAGWARAARALTAPAPPLEAPMSFLTQLSPRTTPAVHALLLVAAEE